MKYCSIILFCVQPFYKISLFISLREQTFKQKPVCFGPLTFQCFSFTNCTLILRYIYNLGILRNMLSQEMVFYIVYLI